jgi:hypothetical protein
MVQVVLRRAVEPNIHRVLRTRLLRMALRGEGPHGILKLQIQRFRGAPALAPGVRTKLRNRSPLVLRREPRTLTTNPPKKQGYPPVI